MAATSSKIADSLNFIETLGFEIVELRVGGPEAKLLRVHKKILCDKIPYFSKMFMGNFAEARENSASFPEDRVESFDLLIEWVYTGVLRPYTYNEITKTTNWRFLSLYTLAEKFCLPQLQDMAMDALRASDRRNGTCLTVSQMSDAYKNTQEGSGYRLYALHTLMFVLQFTEHEKVEFWKTIDIDNMLKENPDMATDYLVWVRSHLGQSRLKKPEDPSKGHSCLYHNNHKMEEECPLKP
ncbi:hypothetical protein ACMFMG_011089 [Clarireedia jacksonii]